MSTHSSITITPIKKELVKEEVGVDGMSDGDGPTDLSTRFTQSPVPLKQEGDKPTDLSIGEPTMHLTIVKSEWNVDKSVNKLKIVVTETVIEEKQKRKRMRRHPKGEGRKTREVAAVKGERRGEREGEGEGLQEWETSLKVPVFNQTFFELFSVAFPSFKRFISSLKMESFIRFFFFFFYFFFLILFRLVLFFRFIFFPTFIWQLTESFWSEGIFLRGFVYSSHLKKIPRRFDTIWLYKYIFKWLERNDVGIDECVLCVNIKFDISIRLSL